MKKIGKWILGALLLMLLGIYSGCGKKETAIEEKNLSGEDFWDFVERKCDSLKPDVLPEKMKFLYLGGAKNGEGGEIKFEKEKDREKLWEILSDVRVIEMEEPDETDYPHPTGAIIVMENDPYSEEKWMRVEITVYGHNEKNKDEDRYRGSGMIHYWDEGSAGCGICCYFTQPNLPKGEPDFVEELQNWYSEIYEEVQSAFPEEGMMLLDVLPEKWDTVSMRGGLLDTEYELKKEDIEKVKEILKPVHIGRQIPYSSFGGRITLIINGDSYTCWNGVINSTNAYKTKWNVLWKLDGDYGYTGYLEKLEELYRTYDAG